MITTDHVSLTHRCFLRRKKYFILLLCFLWTCCCSKSTNETLYSIRCRERTQALLVLCSGVKELGVSGSSISNLRNCVCVCVCNTVCLSVLVLLPPCVRPGHSVLASFTRTLWETGFFLKTSFFVAERNGERGALIRSQKRVRGRGVYWLTMLKLASVPASHSLVLCAPSISTAPNVMHLGFLNGLLYFSLIVHIPTRQIKDMTLK